MIIIVHAHLELSKRSKMFFGLSWNLRKPMRILHYFFFSSFIIFYVYSIYTLMIFFFFAINISLPGYTNIYMIEMVVSNNKIHFLEGFLIYSYMYVILMFRKNSRRRIYIWTESKIRREAKKVTSNELSISNYIINVRCCPLRPYSVFESL